MPFDFDAAMPMLEQAQRFVSEGTQCLETGDYASARYCVYHVFFFSMQALLLGAGQETDRYSETLERFKQHYLDTGLFLDNSFYPPIELALRIHNEEAFEDADLCSAEETAKLMHRAELFFSFANQYVEQARRISEDKRAERELELVLKIMALADEFDVAYSEQDGDRFSVCNNDMELYSVAKSNLQRMMCWGLDGVMEAYARCSLWLIKYDKSQGASVEAESREILGVCRELTRSDPDIWARDTADICEDLADNLLGKEAYDLYLEALKLYRFLYAKSGEESDRDYIENLKFKLGACAPYTDE